MICLLIMESFYTEKNESHIQTVHRDAYHEFITFGVNSKYTFSTLLYIGHTATPGVLYIRAGTCIRAKITSTCIP